MGIVELVVLSLGVGFVGGWKTARSFARGARNFIYGKDRR